MLRDGANGSFMCDLLYQRRNRKNVTGTLCLKEGFLQAGFNSSTLPCGGIGVCVLRFVGGVWSSENKGRKVFWVREAFPLEMLPISLRLSSVVGLLPYGFWSFLFGVAFSLFLKWLYRHYFETWTPTCRRGWYLGRRLCYLCGIRWTKFIFNDGNGLNSLNLRRCGRSKEQGWDEQEWLRKKERMTTESHRGIKELRGSIKNEETGKNQGRKK